MTLTPGLPDGSDPHDAQLTEVTLNSKVILAGNFLHARRDAIRLSDGSHGTRQMSFWLGVAMVRSQTPKHLQAYFGCRTRCLAHGFWTGSFLRLESLTIIRA